jgi:hypothetical protein
MLHRPQNCKERLVLERTLTKRFGNILTKCATVALSKKTSHRRAKEEQREFKRSSGNGWLREVVELLPMLASLPLRLKMAG